MTKIFIINGGQRFENTGGGLNAIITEWTKEFFEKQGAEVKVTNINNAYDPEEEVEKYIWSDLIIYHTPVWWFQIPYKLKEYIDVVFSAGEKNGIYESDGRSRKNANPKLHYGTGGSMQGHKYMLTTTWNAPEEAFTVEGEFLSKYSVDDIFLCMHITHEFVGCTKVDGFDFFDVQKDTSDDKMDKLKEEYFNHLLQQIKHD